MKSDGQYLRAYAKYFVKFIQEYAKEGIQIHALSWQNEPNFDTHEYPTMKVSCDLQQRFIADYLGPAFKSENIATKLLVWDHNWDGVQCVLQILSNSKAKSYIAGSAWHCYGGNSQDLQQVYNGHPDKEFISLSARVVLGTRIFIASSVKLLIGQLKNHARPVMLWNLALDKNGGPKKDVGGCWNCRGVITVKDRTYTREVEYYVLSQFSMFIEAGAVRKLVRIHSQTTGDLDHVAFQNPDGGIVIVIVNNRGVGVTRSFTVKVNGVDYTYELPGSSVGTVTYH